MPWIDSLDWTDLNSLRRFPLREGTSAASDDGVFSIPDTFIVDFSLCASSDVSRRFFISKIFNKLTAVTIEISDLRQDGSQNSVGTFEIARASHMQDSDYFIVASPRYAGTNGKITIGTFEDLSKQPAGSFKFTPASTEFEPRTIIPSMQGIDRITFIDTLNGESTLSGDVILTSRANLKFSYDEDVHRVLLDAGDNLGLSKQCAVNNCVKSINGVAPDPSTGDVGLYGINCIRVYSSAAYTLDIEDTCCTPCSGCNDLEELTGRLTSLENKFLDLKGSYNNVNNQLTTYLSTINSNCACPV